MGRRRQLRDVLRVKCDRRCKNKGIEVGGAGNEGRADKSQREGRSSPLLFEQPGEKSGI
jgi:hypothetical protein